MLAGAEGAFLGCRTITADDIRTTGDYTATIHFHREVKAEIAIEVTRKED